MSATTSPAERALDDRPPRGYRPASRRRARVAGGLALAAVAVGGNVLVYSSLDDRTEVVQAITDIRAGDLVTADDVRIVEADLDPTVPFVAATDIGTVLDHHARVHIASGTLLAPVLVQPGPLVAPDAAVVAVEISPTLVPTGVRERSRVELVVTTDDEQLRTVGRVVTRPTETDGAGGMLSMSVEVDVSEAARIAAAEDVRLVLLDPGDDPVYDGGAG